MYLNLLIVLQIKEILETEYGKQLGLSSIGGVLGMLEKQGRVNASSSSPKGTIKQWHIST